MDWNDRAYVLREVKRHGWALKSASEDLKKDREIVLEAVKNDGCALLFASEDLKKDREIVLEAVKNNWLALYYASKDLQGDREIVLEAVKNSWFDLQLLRKEPCPSPGPVPNLNYDATSTYVSSNDTSPPKTYKEALMGSEPSRPPKQ